MTNDTVFEVIKEILILEFKVTPESIAPEKRLDEDLGLDSLDMVDLLIYLKDRVGEKVSPALFKNACTLRDVVELVRPLWK